ncbi:4-hydroxy-2-oxo-heptane-1,7-dioate aldolase [Paracoccus pantotrophus]|nr:aldolase/citrate lyase family protein [Paracoccus pantotrophus]QFG38648.1 4-hydroxy-2-oxo-heptane-1,7-dioate aldolase [Paracoccus pantotrophus]
MRKNPFLAAIRSGQPQIGLWITLCSGLAAEIVAGADFDWVLLDTEHSPSEIGTVLSQLQAFSGRRTVPIVRPDWNDAVKVKRLMDIGPPGLLFPMVQSPAEAEAAVRATRYPPHGIRGFSSTTRANDFGRIPDYLAHVEEETAVLVQVETRAAILQVDAIGRTDGVDGVFFGPADIAADLGRLGQPMHADVWDTVLPAARRLIAASVPVGTLVSDVDFARRLIAEEGFSFVACGVDTGILARGADALARKMRE